MDNNIADKLKAILDDPATLNTLATLIGSMQSSGTANTDSSEEDEPPQQQIISQPSSEPTNVQAEALTKISQIMNQSSMADDPRINLLNSLKPYMRKSRSAKMDQAIQLIQMSKVANLFKP